MFTDFFKNDSYVKVYPNRFVIKHLITGSLPVTVHADKPFTSERLLIGNYTNAEQTLVKAFRKLFTSQLLRISPAVLMHPTEMVEGGLSKKDKH